MNSQARNIIIGVAAIALLVGGWLFLRSRSVAPITEESATSSPMVAATSSTGSTTTVPIPGTNVSITGKGKFTIKAIPTGPAVPDFKAPLSCASSVSADLCAHLKSDAVAEGAALAKAPTDFNAWIQLGIDRKTAGEYRGAAAAWEYASALYPTNIVSFNNLGDLYMNFLHDYGRAEANYLRQIKNRPDDVNAYYALFTLYSQLYKQNTSAAEDILRQGINANPQAAGLRALLSEYQQSKGH